MSFDVARNVRASIRAHLGAPASSLQSVPEIEQEPTQEAIRKLQLQIFVLTDALAAAVDEIDRLAGRHR